VGVSKDHHQMRLIAGDSPVYPLSSHQIGEEGRVRLWLKIGTDGLVSELKVLISSGYSPLDESALRAAKTWKFERNPENLTGPIVLIKEVAFQIQ
jgi:TonB family protein